MGIFDRIILKNEIRKDNERRHWIAVGAKKGKCPRCKNYDVYYPPSCCTHCAYKEF